MAGLAVFAVVLACLLGAPVKAAPIQPDLNFATVEEVQTWARRGFFGGARTRVYFRDEKELCVVNGTPTSGLLTSQIVVFGRAKPQERFRLLLATAVIRTDMKDKEEERGIGVYERNKLLFLIPFEILTAGEPLPRVPPARK